MSDKEIIQSKQSRYQHPPGYRIFWSEITEHYQWSIGDIESVIFASYSQAYRSAWQHYMENVKPVFCKCGCGLKTFQMKRTKGNYRKGDYRLFVNGHDTRMLSQEEQAKRGRCNDGSTLRGTGEGKAYTKLHGRHLHRVVAEQKLGRALLPGEIVHHKDGNKKNNHPDNIEILPSQGDHCRSHSFGGRKNKLSGGSNE